MMMYGSIPPQVDRNNDNGDKRADTEERNKGRSFILPFILGAIGAFAATLALHVVKSTHRNIQGSKTLSPPNNAPLSSVLPVISARGQSIKPMRDDIEVFFKAASDPYHPDENPDGYLIMLVAENKLMWKEMAGKLEEVQTSRSLPQWIFNYGDGGGQLEFKESMARMMQRWISAPINAANLRFQAGASSILDQLAFLIGDTGDGVLIASPSYPAFPSDFGIHAGLKLHLAPTKPGNGYVPTVEDLDECFDRSNKAGNPPKILIICQPNNPTGIIYSAEAMQLMVDWALDKGLHVISDEIYALSVFPGYKTTSAADVMRNKNPDDDNNYLGDYVHIVHGLSKDWGMSGFRVGSMFTHNKQLLAAMDSVGYYEMVSEYTQFALTGVFKDDEWVEWYIAENQKRLHETYTALQEALSLIQVPLVVPAGGVFFAWADFSSYLKDGQSENELWIELITDAKVLFTTGESCNADKPGMFRIVYPWPEGGSKSMEELGRRLVKWKSERS